MIALEALPDTFLVLAFGDEFDIFRELAVLAQLFFYFPSGAVLILHESDKALIGLSLQTSPRIPHKYFHPAFNPFRRKSLLAVVL